MKKLPLILLASMVFAASSASAGERFGLRGHWELGGSVDFTSTSFSQGSNSSSVFSIQPYVGYFPINRLEIGLRPMVLITSPANGNSTTDFAMFVAPAWNFSSRGAAVTPFVEGLLGFASVEDSVAIPNTNPVQKKAETASGVSYGGRGGVKVQVSDFGLLNFALQYISLDRTLSGISSRENRFSVSVGFTVFAY